MHQNRVRGSRRPAAGSTYIDLIDAAPGGAVGAAAALWGCLAGAPNVERYVKRSFGSEYPHIVDVTYCSADRIPLTWDAVQRDVQAKAVDEMSREVAALRVAYAEVTAALRHLARRDALESVGLLRNDLPEPAELKARLEEALTTALDGALASVEVVESEDDDMGGPVLEARVGVSTSREAFRDARRRALTAFGEVARDMTTRRVVLLVQRV